MLLRTYGTEEGREAPRAHHTSTRRRRRRRRRARRRSRPWSRRERSSLLSYSSSAPPPQDDDRRSCEEEEEEDCNDRLLCSPSLPPPPPPLPACVLILREGVERGGRSSVPSIPVWESAVADRHLSCGNLRRQLPWILECFHVSQWRRETHTYNCTTTVLCVVCT